MLRYDPSRRTVHLHIHRPVSHFTACISVDKIPPNWRVIVFKGHGRIRKVLDAECLAFWFLGLYLYTKVDDSNE